jgi:hypothetical protein
MPEFIDGYPFLTFPFTDFDQTKKYVGKNGQRFF